MNKKYPKLIYSPSLFPHPGKSNANKSMPLFNKNKANFLPPTLFEFPWRYITAECINGSLFWGIKFAL